MGKFIDSDYAKKTVSRSREKKISIWFLTASIVVLIFSTIFSLKPGIYAAGLLLVISCAFSLKAWSHYFKNK